MLWACLILPSLPLDVFARAQAPADAGTAFAVATGGHYPRIVIANAAALQAGIRPQQLVSASLALAPGLVLRDHDPAAEASALAAVAGWATQFTPAVSLAPPNAVLAEIGGSLRLFGGWPKLEAQFIGGVRELGYAARLSLAPTPTAALLFARAGNKATANNSGPDFSPNAGEENARAARLATRRLDEALAPLPLALTDADPEVIAMLAAAGITTFGQACALPRNALARRAGAEFVAMLDRTRGLVPDPRPPFVPPPRYTGTLALPAPVANLEALAFAVNRLVHELAGWLLGRGLGVVAMSLALAHERYVSVKTGVPATAVRFALAAPAREPAHLVAVLRERLARVALPAPVEAIALASEATAPLAGRNLGLLPGDEATATVPLLDRLRARLGEDAVTLVVPLAEHRPERAWRPTARDACPESEAARDASRGSGSAKIGARTIAPNPVFTALPPRPVWLLAEPEPLGHLIATQPWVLRDGPERIESGWWDGADVRRDYFVAENPRGETLWIYRDHRYGVDDGEWFVHGVFA
jgi:protein ImuB